MSAKTAKKFQKNIRARNWNSAEVTLLAEVLADEEHNFTAALEELALKKAASNEVFTLIQKIFDQQRRENHFIEVNKAENFTNAKGVVSEYTLVDTLLEKLRRKYTTLKAEWRKISDRCKNGSGLAPEKEPSWYKILNTIFSGKNESFHLAEGNEDLSFNLHNDSIDSDDENSFQKSDEESLHEEGEQNVIRRATKETPVNGDKKLVVAPHRKRNIVRSQNQALSKIAKRMEDLAGAQTERTKLMIEVDRKRDELFLKQKADEAQRTREYKAEEASKNREHELILAQMYASVRPASRGSVVSICLSAIYAKSIWK